jgi:hypothetical protein
MGDNKAGCPPFETPRFAWLLRVRYFCRNEICFGEEEIE